MIRSLLIAFIAVSLLGASCTLKRSSDTVLQTVNDGVSWKPKSLVRTSQGKLLRLSSAEATFIEINPVNSLQLWLGTKKHGLFVSENAGDHWVQVIAGGMIADIALDPTARCTLYVALEKKVLRTTNCAESWDLIYNETRATAISALALDWADPQNVYIATKAGDIFKSTNRGESWDSIFGTDDEIIGIVIDRIDAAIVTIATKNMRIERSFNKGSTWTTLTPSAEVAREGLGIFRSMQPLRKKEHLFIVSSKGLWKLTDYGRKWSYIPPLTPPSSVSIRIGVINLNDEQEFYYATKNTFYHSVDNGINYASQELDTARLPASLSIDPNNPTILYLGLAEEERVNYF